MNTRQNKQLIRLEKNPSFYKVDESMAHAYLNACVVGTCLITPSEKHFLHKNYELNLKIILKVAAGKVETIEVFLSEDKWSLEVAAKQQFCSPEELLSAYLADNGIKPLNVIESSNLSNKPDFFKYEHSEKAFFVILKQLKEKNIKLPAIIFTDIPTSVLPAILEAWSMLNLNLTQYSKKNWRAIVNKKINESKDKEALLENYFCDDDNQKENSLNHLFSSSYRQIQAEWKKSSDDLFVNQVTSLAQGFFDVGSVLARLPLDLFKIIVAYVGSDLIDRSEENILDMSLLVMENVQRIMKGTKLNKMPEWKQSVDKEKNKEIVSVSIFSPRLLKQQDTKVCWLARYEIQEDYQRQALK